MVPALLYIISATKKLYFGLGAETEIDSVKVVWQNGKEQIITQNKINSFIVIDYKNVQDKLDDKAKGNALFVNINPKDIGINFIQKENIFNDFDLQLLLPQKQSEFSNPLVVGDVNNDGLVDFFVGNAKDAKASLYIQKEDGTFIESNQKLFDIERKYEDTDAKFFYADNDNNLELYVTSG